MPASYDSQSPALVVERNIRSVSLGNGLYPTQALASRLGVPLADLSATFWKGRPGPARGGTNVSDFGLAAAVTAPTLTVDGETLIDKGALK